MVVTYLRQPDNGYDPCERQAGNVYDHIRKI
jgi:hypothetical protein